MSLQVVLSKLRNPQLMSNQMKLSFETHGNPLAMTQFPNAVCRHLVHTNTLRIP